ncbi:MAG: carbonic anhydrase family protein [Chthoniobacterales bacterium]
MRVLPLFTLSLFAITAFAADECPPPFSYCGYTGPEQWPNIAIKGKVNECAGTRQSPINLPKLTPTPGPLIRVEYVAGKATILNTGHDIEVTPAGDAGMITVGDNRNPDNVYKLVKFHFHVPSEHYIDGVKQPAEMHIVHQRVKGDKTYIAVIGVILAGDGDGSYPALEPVFKRLPKNVCDKVENVPINFPDLLPQTLKEYYYTYAGSLTTPPCSQNVTWYVLGEPRKIPASDLRNLSALGANARPIQVSEPPLPVTYIRPQ